MSDEDNKVLNEEDSSSALTEGDGGGSPQTLESADVLDPESLQKRLSSLEKQARENQARADRAEARASSAEDKIKDMERKGMSELDIIKAELEEEREKARSYEIAWTQRNAENRRDELVLEAGLPYEARLNVTPSFDEAEMRSSIDNLLGMITSKEEQKKAPFVSGGTPSVDAVGDKLKAAKEKGDPDAAIRAHREAMEARRLGG